MPRRGQAPEPAEPRSPLDDYRLNNNAAAATPTLPDRSPSAYEQGSADYEASLGEDPT